MRYIFTLIIFLFVGVFAKAQFLPPCVDSNRIDNFFQCNDPAFLPVCGCNNVTYRNECAAFRNGGVNSISYNGVCQNDYFFHAIYSNRVTSELNLYVQFYKAAPVNIQIRDSYGKLMYNNNYLSIDSRKFTFPTSELKSGMYYVFLSSGGAFSFERFVKL